MSAFGTALFGRSKFLFWTLAPCLLLGALVVTFPADYEDSHHLAAVLLCDATAALLILSLWPYHLVPGVRRALTGLIAGAYALYTADAWFPGLLPPKGDPSDRLKASMGFVIIGLPCLKHAISGRFRLDPEPIEIDEQDPLMQTAVAEARAALPRLRRGFAECPHSTLVRFAFVTDATHASGEALIEHLWGDLLELTATEARIEIVTQPHFHSEFVDELRLPVDAIEDWEVGYPDGTLDGGFTTRALVEYARRESLAIPRHVQKQLALYRTRAA